LSVRAAVITAPGQIELRRFPVPEPGPGVVVMRVSLSGICGTDKHTFRGETIQYAGTPHERQIEYPLICGHENVGVVETTGGEVLAADGTPLRPGDRIVPGANVVCGACWYCLNDEPYYFCERLEDYGNSLNVRRPPSLFGGWSELMYLLPRTRLFRVPDELRAVARAAHAQPRPAVARPDRHPPPSARGRTRRRRARAARRGDEGWCSTPPCS